MTNREKLMQVSLIALFSLSLGLQGCSSGDGPSVGFSTSLNAAECDPDFPDCVPEEPVGCFFDELFLPHSTTITAFQSSVVAHGQTCQSETRVCDNGVLSGSFLYASCVVTPPVIIDPPNPVPIACQFNNKTVAHQSSVLAYAQSSVTAGECVSEVRQCNNGQLSGSYQHATCTKAPSSIYYNGIMFMYGYSFMYANDCYYSASILGFAPVQNVMLDSSVFVCPGYMPRANGDNFQHKNDYYSLGGSARCTKTPGVGTAPIGVDSVTNTPVRSTYFVCSCGGGSVNVDSSRPDLCPW